VGGSIPSRRIFALLYLSHADYQFFYHLMPCRSVAWLGQPEAGSYDSFFHWHYRDFMSDCSLTVKLENPVVIN
jgi:hypothetical protein